MIVEPPAIGQAFDAASGKWRPQTILEGRINGQYIIEGLTGSFLFVLGGIGVILLDKSSSASMSGSIVTDGRLTIAIGVLCVFLAYTVSMTFLRIKVPGYGLV